jgi:hypothetical protein
MAIAGHQFKEPFVERANSLRQPETLIATAGKMAQRGRQCGIIRLAEPLLEPVKPGLDTSPRQPSRAACSDCPGQSSCSRSR